MEVMKRFLVVLTIILCVIAVLAIAQWTGTVTVFSQHREVLYENNTETSPTSSPIQYITPIPQTSQEAQIYICTNETQLYESSDERWCRQAPLMNSFRLFQIDLTNNRILFFENGRLAKTFPIAYQAPYGKWFQTPTGYFQIGVKKEKFMSSIVPVYMEDAVQIYEDFFIHNIPYHPDGTKVTSQFSGGCIRLDDPVARDFYSYAQKGDAVVSYLTFDKAVIKEGLFPPADLAHMHIRQRFNSPLKTDWAWHEEKKENYIQHTGVDIAPNPEAKNLNVYSIATGTVETIVRNGVNDGGLGNAIIIKYKTGSSDVYGLYGHLYSIEPHIQEGVAVSGGDVIGVMGATGYGCSYWRIGGDGCDASGELDVHIHFELKTKPVLQAPIDDVCKLPSGKVARCIGYTSVNPTEKGYFDPLLFLFKTF